MLEIEKNIGSGMSSANKIEPLLNPASQMEIPFNPLTENIEKTRQDKRQDKTRQKKRKDKTREKTREKTRQDKTSLSQDNHQARHGATRYDTTMEVFRNLFLHFPPM